MWLFGTTIGGGEPVHTLPSIKLFFLLTMKRLKIFIIGTFFDIIGNSEHNKNS